jgi:8-oxo-dGTP pyrophosphatase MutT (NUDIX family)
MWDVRVVSKKIRIEWEDGSFWSRAAGIMVGGKKRVLLSRLEDEDVWVLPGGTISLYETSEETVKREFLEETGFEIEVHRLLWIIENFFVFNDDKCHEIGFYFLVSPKEAKRFWEQEEFIGQEEQHTPDKSWKLIFKWFDPSELDKLNLKPSVLIKLLKNIPEHPVHIIHHA